MASDPFTQVYDALVAEFKKSYRNVVSYNTIGQPKKDIINATDLPELTVLPDTATVNLGIASCETTVEFTYQILVATGNQRLGPVAFPVMYSLLKTYHRIRYGDVLTGLQINDRNFVEDSWAGVATYDLGAAERGILGWACLWPIIVRLSFSPEDLA